MSRSDTSNLPLVIAQPPLRGRRPASPGRAGAAALEAQTQARRGLRDEGSLGRARQAYLETQWSGEHDRRPEPGLLTRTRL